MRVELGELGSCKSRTLVHHPHQDKHSMHDIVPIMGHLHYTEMVLNALNESDAVEMTIPGI